MAETLEASTLSAPQRQGGRGGPIAERSPYITRVPSSALLTQSITDSFQPGFSATAIAQLRVKKDAENELLSRLSAAGVSLPPYIDWRIFTSADDSHSWVVYEVLHRQGTASASRELSVAFSQTTQAPSRSTDSTAPSSPNKAGLADVAKATERTAVSETATRPEGIAAKSTPSETSTIRASGAYKGSVVRHSSGILEGLKGGAILHTILEKAADLLAGPPDVSQCRSVVIGPEHSGAVPTQSASVLMEVLKVRAGHQTEFIEACRAIDRSSRSGDDESASKSTDQLPIIENFGSFSFGVEVHQDTAIQNKGCLFTVLYQIPEEGDWATIRRGDAWRRWRRHLLPLLEGPSRIQILHEAFNSKHAATKSTVAAVPSSPEGSPVQHVPDIDWSKETDGTAVVQDDPLLAPFAEALKDRFEAYLKFKEELLRGPVGLHQKSLADMARSAYRSFGIHRSKTGWLCREWAPGAKQLYLAGDFNQWSFESHPFVKNTDEDAYGAGVWEMELSADVLYHACKIKVVVEDEVGNKQTRVPAWSPVVWEQPETKVYDGAIWDPPPSETYVFKHPRPAAPSKLFIYEAYVGAASQKAEFGTYSQFTESVLPRIQRLGYNVLLLFGALEHAPATFGWHSLSCFAPMSKCGTPEEFKKLVDTAHSKGISVVLSVVHSHASPAEGVSLVKYDGLGESFYRDGTAGTVPQWDARIYDYGKPEVVRYLLASLAYLSDSYRVDGFRFEALGAMMYHHRTILHDFDDSSAYDYNNYFSFDVDSEAVRYLMAANETVHSLEPATPLLTLGHDTSHMPTLAAPMSKGGIGFDYRINPKGASLIQEMLLNADENWDLGALVDAMKRKRTTGEKQIVFTEDWDKVVVGRRRMRICMFAWESLHTHAVGGVSPHVTELGAALSRLGHEVHIYVRSTGTGARHAVHYGVHYHECPFNLNRDFVSEMNSMCQSFAWHMGETETFHRERFDICHAHDWLAAKAGVIVKATGHTVIQTIHSTEYGRCGNVAYGGESKRIADIESEACHVSDRVIAVSGVLAEEVVRLYGIHPQKIAVVYNGINAQNFDGFEDAAPIKAQYGIAALEPMFLFVGRLVTQKGPDLLIEAIPHVLRARGDAKFVIVGDGYMRKQLEDRAAHLNVKHAVRFLGSKGGSELKSLFKACDAVVVPSRNEPFGIVVLEGWSAYKPVVATTCGGPRDFVTHDVDGFLVNPEAGSIAWGCCKILENFAHARWMGERGRVKAAFNFSWDTIASQTRAIYYEQLCKHDAPYGYGRKGDGSLAAKLMGGAMVDHMQIFDENESISRGMALHMLLRLLTLVLSDAGVLNFMGCEFGHPNCIDVPRPSNSMSYENFLRRWDLADNRQLKYKHLELFEASMLAWERRLSFMDSEPKVTHLNEEDKVLCVERGNVLVVFNFHPTKSYTDYQMGHNLVGGDFKLVFSTEDGRFGGLGRFAPDTHVPNVSGSNGPEASSIKLYLPSRCGLALAPAHKLASLDNTTMDAKLCEIGPDEFIDLGVERSNDSAAARYIEP